MHADHAVRAAGDAARDEMGIDEVFDARSLGRQDLVRTAEDVLFHFRVLDDRLHHEIGGSEIV